MPQLVVLIGAWIWYELGSAGLAQSSQCHTGITFCIAHSVSIGKQFKSFLMQNNSNQHKKLGQKHAL